MEATILSLDWIKSESCVVTGVKGNRVPKHTVRGGNGSFRTATPSYLTISLLADDGTEIEKNIYDDVMQMTGWERLSEARFKKLENAFEAKNTFTIIKVGNRFDLYYPEIQQLCMSCL